MINEGDRAKQHRSRAVAHHMFDWEAISTVKIDLHETPAADARKKAICTLTRTKSHATGVLRPRSAGFSKRAWSERCTKISPAPFPTMRSLIRVRTQECAPFLYLLAERRSEAMQQQPRRGVGSLYAYMRCAITQSVRRCYRTRTQAIAL